MQRVLDVTVVLMDDGLSSTAIMPAEIFHSAGAPLERPQLRAARPRFRVRTVTVRGGSVRSPYGIGMAPAGAIDDVERTDIIIVPSSGLETDLYLVENSALLPWLRHHHDAGRLCRRSLRRRRLSRRGGPARRPRRHHPLGGVRCSFAQRWPQVDWRPEMFVTEDARLLCSGGVCGSIDVSLYLVEKLCGHEVAVQCAKALLLPMPRIYQSGYSVLPVSPQP